MKLGDIFNTEQGEPLIGKKVTFPLLKPVADGHEVYNVTAILHVLTELDRREAYRKAEEALKEEYKESVFSIPEETRAIEHTIWQMVFCLYQVEDERKRFLDKDVQLFKKSVTAETIIKLSREYKKFIKDEFPDEPTDSQLDEMVDEAVKKY